MDTSKGTKVKRMVVCAAKYYVHDTVYDIQQPWDIEKGLVVCGHNHSVCSSMLKLLFPDRRYIGHTIDGFVTSDHYFVGREEALEIATEAGQIFHKYSPRSKLLSEDLRPFLGD